MTSQAVKSSLTYLQQDLGHFSQLSAYVRTMGPDILPTTSINGSIMLNKATVWRAYITQLLQCNLNNAIFESITGCDAVVRQWNLWTDSRFFPQIISCSWVDIFTVGKQGIYLVLKSAAVMQRLWLTTSPVIIMLHSWVLGFGFIISCF